MFLVELLYEIQQHKNFCVCGLLTWASREDGKLAEGLYERVFGSTKYGLEG